MSFRYMRMLVMFDLPVETSLQRRNYRKFRKFLLGRGFIMEQYSIYSKLVLNKSVEKSVERQVKENLPPVGKVQMLSVTEKQYASILYLRGEAQSEVEASTVRKVIL